jgi:hypothetical protein
VPDLNRPHLPIPSIMLQAAPHLLCPTGNIGQILPVQINM